MIEERADEGRVLVFLLVQECPSLRRMNPSSVSRSTGVACLK